MNNRYDLVVIGSGPAGQKAAISAAKLGKRVALIEQQLDPGGVCTHTGTIPSKALREAVLHLTGVRQRGHYGASYAVKPRITMHDLTTRVRQIIVREADVIRGQMDRNGVELIFGRAVFIGPHLLCVESSGLRQEIVADHVLLACGTRPARPEHVPFTPQRVFDSDELLQLPELPRSMIIVGAGVIGVEYACMFQAVGVNVTLIDARERMLEFLDREIGAALAHHIRSAGVRICPAEKVAEIRLVDGGVCARLESGKSVAAETLLYSIGRQGATDGLDLESAGLTPDERGRVRVNERFQTDAPHIYAAGDVIGFPALASTSMEQGRLASCYAFDAPCESMLTTFPYGIYTVPEVSMVGPTEQELSRDGVPYGVGVSHYREISRGHLLGDPTGMLKLLFHEHDRRLLAVHALGTGATEIIHIGQAVIAFGGTIDYFVDNVFNYPTLAECYKVAALDGINRMRLMVQTPVPPAPMPADGDLDRAEAAAAAL